MSKSLIILTAILTWATFSLAQPIQYGYHQSPLSQILFWDFEIDFEKWEQTGTAFHNQPTFGHNVRMDRVTEIALGGDYWKDLDYPIGHSRNFWVGTAENRPNQGSPIGATQGNSPVGSLTSPPFNMRSSCLTFLISGGNKPDSLTLELLVLDEDSGRISFPEGNYKIAHTATGHNSERFRRDWWRVDELNKKSCRVRIRDQAKGKWGHINVDEIRFQQVAPVPRLDTASPTIEWVDGVPVDYKAPVWGYVDLHSHPMSFMGFGGKAIHGTFDGDPAKALGPCGSSHGAWSPWNSRGNLIRNAALGQVEEFADGKAHGKGFHPNPKKAFKRWPKFWSPTHQQMWVDWLERAHAGGLSVLVALAVNNELLADALQGDPPFDDQTVARRQTDSLKAAVARHDFMEIAYNPQQMRSIVRRGKLAIVMGIETDHIGNFKAGDEVTRDQVRNVIRRLYELGIRYIFPIHLVNNPFGGAAVYEELFNLANKYATGAPFEIEKAPVESHINFNLEGGNNGFLGLISLGNRDFPKDVLPVKNNYPTYVRSATGHRNVQGLTPLGEFAIREMMSLGMIIDIDHMSEKAANRTLEIAGEMKGGYPINSGHNGFRMEGKPATENQRTPEQVSKMVELGGMMGVGMALGKGGVGAAFTELIPKERQQIATSDVENTCSGSGRSFVQNYLFAQELFRGRNVSIGTDASGLVAFPCPRYGPRACFQIRKEKAVHAQHVAAQDSADRVTYWGGAAGKSAPLVPCETAGHRWDINVDGVAHYGLFPDLWQDLRNVGMSKEDMTRLMLTAEDFAVMWERCLRVAGR